MMRMTKRMLIPLILMLAAACYAGERPGLQIVQQSLKKTYGTVTSVRRADLDKDGTLEIIAITRQAVDNGHPMGGVVVVLKEVDGSLCPVWWQKNLNPWKLRIADVDGDKKQEIITGVWKKSPKDPVMAKRVFVWNWTGKRLTPKWLGSRLSRRFVDFEVRDINKDGWAELLAMEVAPGKSKRIGIYRWRSFGFDWLGSAEPAKWKELTNDKQYETNSSCSGNCSYPGIGGADGIEWPQASCQ